MSETLNLTAQTALGSLTETDLLYAESGGTMRPVSWATLLKGVQSQYSRSTALSLNGGEWVRVAKLTLGVASCILVATHTWSTGRPVALVAAINATGGNKDGCYAERLTKNSFFAPSSGTGSTNTGLSFNAIRFVAESGTTYIEVKFKETCKTANIYTALGASAGVELLAASKSTAADADVLKTVELADNVGGVKYCISVDYANGTFALTEGGVPHERVDGGYGSVAYANAAGRDGLPWDCQRAVGGCCESGDLPDELRDTRIGTDFFLGSGEHPTTESAGGHGPRCGRRAATCDCIQRRYADGIHPGQASWRMETLVQDTGYACSLVVTKRRKEVVAA